MTRQQFLYAAAGAGAGSFGATSSAPENSAIYAIPPLARKNDARRSLDFAENEKILRFLLANGMRHVAYGGNAFLYDITLGEYGDLLGWLARFAREAFILPAVGPSYGRAMDQAPLVRRYRFPGVLALPNGNPRDAAGLEAGYREIAQACGVPLSLYVKSEAGFGDDSDAGLDVLGRLVADKVCVSIKYAIVRKDPREDAYLASLLKRVAPGRVISGLGERPAIVHLRDFKLNGFTTGSGVLAPRQCRALLDACNRADYPAAEELRRVFMPLEDLREAWGPPRVLHSAVELSGLARTGAPPPFVSRLSDAQLSQLRPVAAALLERKG